MLATTRPKTLKPVTQQALNYAKNQWPVFPLKPGTKIAATPKHLAADCDGSDPKCLGGHTGWEQRATTDPDRIVRAWEQHNYGVAIACGPAGLLVVDLDVAKDGGVSGAVSLNHLEEQHRERLPETYTVGTPSGGYHLYYHQPDGQHLRNRKPGVGIDTRGHGGYVAAPPTRLSGRSLSYEVLKDLPVEVLPQWFSQLLTTTSLGEAEPLPRNTPLPGPVGGVRVRRYVETAIARQLDYVTHAPVGQRNQTIFTAALALGQLIGAGVADQTTITERIKTAAAVHVGKKGCTWSEIDRTITSGLRKGINQPRNLPEGLTQDQPARTRNADTTAAVVDQPLPTNQ